MTPWNVDELSTHVFDVLVPPPVTLPVIAHETFAHATAGLPGYFPRAQSTHTADPSEGLYLPSAHPVQLPLAPVQPGIQAHALMSLLLTGERELAGQGEQAKFPGDGLYVPAAHSAHVSTLERVHPALQAHALMSLLLAGGTEFAGQATQLE